MLPKVAMSVISLWLNLSWSGAPEISSSAHKNRPMAFVHFIINLILAFF
jgi:hypothetical protein